MSQRPRQDAHGQLVWLDPIPTRSHQPPQFLHPRRSRNLLATAGSGNVCALAGAELSRGGPTCERHTHFIDRKSEGL
jgi:hypothetical protein